jgi:predicted short-subunit dehydrogenase-like oxidoreductase (DUF2520 family)
MRTTKSRSKTTTGRTRTESGDVDGQEAERETSAGGAVLGGRAVSIVGAGKVGQAVGSLLRDAGVRIAGVSCRDDDKAAAAALATGGRPETDPAAAARDADIVLLTVPDDAIGVVADEIASRDGFRAGQVVAHLSGTRGLDVLAPALEAGAGVACLHPIQSFASAAHARKVLPGTFFGVTADGEARDVANEIVSLLGGVSVDVRDEQKTLYHAAAVVASNYLVALEDIAASLLVEAGFDEGTASRALFPLVRGTVANIREFGTARALTGPVARGDVETVRIHLDALAALSADRLRMYKVLGRHALTIAWESGRLDEGEYEALGSLLAEDDASEGR